MGVRIPFSLRLGGFLPQSKVIRKVIKYKFFFFFFRVCVCFLPVNVVILVLLSIAFLIIVHRNLLNLSDFLKQDGSGIKSEQP